MGIGAIQRPLGWLSDPQMAMGSVIAVNVWKGIPFFTLLLLAGLKAIDNEQLEAAEVDGANGVQRFRYVTLPGLAPMVAADTVVWAKELAAYLKWEKSKAVCVLFLYIYVISIFMVF